MSSALPHQIFEIGLAAQLGLGAFAFLKATLRRDCLRSLSRRIPGFHDGGKTPWHGAVPAAICQYEFVTFSETFSKRVKNG